ncbi:MAG: orotidine-5'-phosphate decarboxylase [Deltaproteobacteria bacterium]|nr:orotidine-5'-phosphate decarboxylase [Deltaproteobacteria bacterium]
MPPDFSRPLKNRDRLVFPLDLPDLESALKYVSLLKDEVGFFKVGLELFTALGPDFLKRLKDLAPERGIFLDLKLHDIPQTVGRAARAAARLEADILTVHAQGGEKMLQSARENAGKTLILGVTLLTSLNAEDMAEIAPELRSGARYPLFMARRALSCGLGGVVASPLELATFREELGKEAVIAVPGLRPLWARVKGDDQVRVASPAAALSAGATLLVVGRPIRDADDPVLAARKTVEELDEALLDPR